jgi:hypothetical protein
MQAQPRRASARGRLQNCGRLGSCNGLEVGDPAFLNGPICPIVSSSIHLQSLSWMAASLQNRSGRTRGVMVALDLCDGSTKSTELPLLHLPAALATGQPVRLLG